MLLLGLVFLLFINCDFLPLVWIYFNFLKVKSWPSSAVWSAICSALDIYSLSLINQLSKGVCV